jgi:hypothetical protein
LNQIQAQNGVVTIDRPNNPTMETMNGEILNSPIQMLPSLSLLNSHHTISQDLQQTMISLPENENSFAIHIGKLTVAAPNLNQMSLQPQ